MTQADKRKRSVFVNLGRGLFVLCIFSFLPDVKAERSVAYEGRSGVSGNFVSNSPVALREKSNVIQGLIFDEIGARLMLEKMSRLASTISRESAMIPASKEELDCIPDRCATAPVTSDGEILSQTYPELYLDYLKRADEWGKEYFLSRYRGPWNPEIETQVLSFVAQKERCESVFPLLVENPSSEAKRLLLEKTRSRWARERWAAIEALVKLNPKLGWGLYTRAITSDPSLNLCERAWSNLIELEDPRVETWFGEFLSRRSPERIQFVAAAFKGQADDLIEKGLARYALNTKGKLRETLLESLCLSKQVEADGLFGQIDSHSPIHWQKLWCRHVWVRGDVTALHRLKIYAQSRDRELAIIASEAIDDLTATFDRPFSKR